MNYIKKFYGKEYLNNKRMILSHMQKPKGIPYFLVSNSSGAKIRQKEFNKYLKLAYHHNIIDNDLRSRLMSTEWETFFQARQELMCAYFIEKILKYKISFYPKGADNSIGDFSIKVSNNEEIFVEVKAPIRESSNVTWVGNDSDVIMRNVKRARSQMPSNDTKNLIMFAGDLRILISQEDIGIIEALYGEHIITFLVGPNGPLSEPGSSFKPSGLFQPAANTRISAVAILEDFMGSPYLDSCFKHVFTEGELPFNKKLPRHIFRYVFKVYHNPYAKNPIDIAVFKDWPQFVFNKNEMEWINKNEE